MNIATALGTSDMQLSDMLRKVGEFERAQKSRRSLSDWWWLHVLGAGRRGLQAT